MAASIGTNDNVERLQSFQGNVGVDEPDMEIISAKTVKECGNNFNLIMTNLNKSLSIWKSEKELSRPQPRREEKEKVVVKEDLALQKELANIKRHEKYRINAEIKSKAADIDKTVDIYNENCRNICAINCRVINKIDGKIHEIENRSFFQKVYAVFFSFFGSKTEKSIKELRLMKKEVQHRNKVSLDALTIIRNKTIRDINAGIPLQKQMPVSRVLLNTF